MELELGFHVHTQEAAERHGTFDEEMSIVEFLRRVERMEELPIDATIYGLDEFLRGANTPSNACDYIHDILRDRANFLLTENPRVQFVVKGVEYWDEPVLRDGEREVQLKKIFHGVNQEGPGWYYSNINVQS